MSPLRLAALTLGPVVILAASYALSRPTVDPDRQAFLARVEAGEARGATSSRQSANELSAACAAAARSIESLLPSGFTVLIRPPFVLAGDIQPDRLEALHQNSLQPTASAIWRAYCDRKPEQPVTVLAIAEESSYRRLARELDGYDVTSYAAYYNREARRIVLHLGTGAGTLAHELTHALVHADFPDLPEWLDEGLASLHEEARFSADGLLLIPLPNWRSRLLLEAVRKNRLPPLENLVRTQSFRGEGEGLNYAYVRCLCLYLHERQLLSHFYRKFRQRSALDPSGLQTLCEVLGIGSCADLDRDLSQWTLDRFSVRSD